MPRYKLLGKVTTLFEWPNWLLSKMLTGVDGVDGVDGYPLDCYD